jgi:hypothetical protein
MLEGDIELTALTAGERWTGRHDHGARFAQRDLIQVVGKSDRDFDSTQRAGTRIHQIGGERRHFLVQKILRPAQCNIFDVDRRGVGLLGGAKGEMCFLRRGTWRRLAPRRKIKRANDDNDRSDGEDQGEIESATLRLRSIGNLDLWLFVHKSNTKFRTFQATGRKIRLHVFRMVE